MSNANDVLTTLQGNMLVRQPSQPETFTGARITGAVVKGSGGKGEGAILLVKRRDGASLGTISLADDAKLYNLEEDVLWAKVFMMPTTANAIYGVDFEATVKAQRKLRDGDGIYLIWFASTANMADLFVSVTAFFKI